jgi:hypothetical protein
MIKFLDHFNANHTLGAAKAHQGLTIFPIIQREPRERTYLTLPEALAVEGVAIAEVSEAGVVSRVGIKNSLASPVLLIDGEELVGAKQNRVVNTSILVAAQSDIVIPVSCTEHGRWRRSSAKFADSGVVLPPSVRHRKMASVGRSIRETRERSSDQIDVWEAISEFSARAKRESPTGAMRDVFKGFESPITDARVVFAPVDGQVGFVAMMGGRVLGLDCLSCADAYQHLYPKLIAGYTVEALVHGVPEGESADQQDVQWFLDELGLCQEEAFPGVSLGEEYRYQGPGVVGTALVHDGQVVHASFQRCAVAVPFPRSYWVEPGRLLAGYYPGAPAEEEAEAKLGALLDAGIRCFVNLVEEEEKNASQHPLRPYQPLLAKLAANRGIEVTYLRIPVRDQDITTTSTMKTILDTIDSALAQNRPTYVHCWGGRGRTGTVVGCYLARHGKATGEKALARVASLRRNEATHDQASPENEVQRSMVRQWGQGQ